MLGFNLIPPGTKFNFIPHRKLFFIFSGLLMLFSIGLFTIKGLNYGIDFQGGIMMDVRTSQAADIGKMRSQLGALGLGEVALQEFGQPNDVLIRIQRQKGGEAAQQAAIAKVKEALGPGVEYRRTEFVGPKVSKELVCDGGRAVSLALLSVTGYAWFRS